MRVAAIDQGTTSTRALVFAPDQKPELTFSRRHRQFTPSSGWVEHDPLELLADVRSALTSAGPVDAFGIANQGESCLAWDRLTGEPLSRVIVWQDGRTVDEIKALKTQGLSGEVAQRAGLPLNPYFSASKLAWILRECPAARAAYANGRLRLGTTDGFFLRNLSGVDATDSTTASRTSLMNLATQAWDPRLCQIFDVPIGSLPPIRTSAGSFGEYLDTPILASIVDQQAALFGHNCRRPGELKITFGTGAFALAPTAQIPDATLHDGLAATIAWSTADETRYAIEGGVYDAGAAIEWAMRIGVIGDVAELEFLAGHPAIAEGLVFVPALSGLAAPQWDTSARGLWLGISTSSDQSAMRKSILEGIALQTTSVVDAMRSRVGPIDYVSVDGGLAKSAYFLSVLAEALQAEIRCPEFTEMTALGCARLAGFDAMIECGPYSNHRPTEGSATWRDVYRPIYERALQRCRGWWEPLPSAE